MARIFGACCPKQYQLFCFAKQARRSINASTLCHVGPRHVGRYAGRLAPEFDALRLSCFGHQVAQHHTARQPPQRNEAFRLGLQRWRLDFLPGSRRAHAGASRSGFAIGLGLPTAVSLGGGRTGAVVCRLGSELVGPV